MSNPAPQSSPCISVMIPVFNSGKYLAACLDSVLGQTYQNLDVMIVNDTSTDDSLEIAERYAARDSRLRIFTVPNLGISVARNIGVREARGEWIAFADSDDIVPPDAYETLLNAALSNNTAIAMGAYAEYHTDKWPRFVRPVPAKPFVCHTAEEAQRYFLTDGKFLTHLWSKIFRKDVFEGVEFPVGKIYEDIAVMAKLMDNARSVTVVNHTIYHYMVHIGSLSTGVQIKRQMTGLDVRLDYAAYIREHHPKLAALANDAVLVQGCDLLGKIEHVGIEKAQPEWDRTVSVMRELLPDCALQNLGYRLGAAAFRKNPRLLSRFVHFLFKLDGML